MPVETLINEKMNFQSTPCSCMSPGCEGQTVYGLKIESTDDIVFQLNDISSNEIDVLRLIAIIKEQSVSIDQLSYIVEDFIQSLYM